MRRTANLPEAAQQALERCSRLAGEWKDDPGEPTMNILYCLECRNAIMAAAVRRHKLARHAGLPARLLGMRGRIW